MPPPAVPVNVSSEPAHTGDEFDAEAVVGVAKPAIISVPSFILRVPAVLGPPHPYNLNVMVWLGPRQTLSTRFQSSGLAVCMVAIAGPKLLVTAPMVYCICTFVGPVALTCDRMKRRVICSSVVALLVIVKKMYLLLACANANVPPTCQSRLL